MRSNLVSLAGLAASLSLLGVAQGTPRYGDNPTTTSSTAQGYPPETSSAQSSASESSSVQVSSESTIGYPPGSSATNSAAQGYTPETSPAQSSVVESSSTQVLPEGTNGYPPQSSTSAVSSANTAPPASSETTGAYQPPPSSSGQSVVEQGTSIIPDGSSTQSSVVEASSSATQSGPELTSISSESTAAPVPSTAGDSSVQSSLADESSISIPEVPSASTSAPGTPPSSSVQGAPASSSVQEISVTTSVPGAPPSSSVQAISETASVPGAPPSSSVPEVPVASSTEGAPASTSTCAIQLGEGDLFCVGGVRGTGIQPRLDIRVLEQDADSWNIFIQALASFQAMDQDEKLSYYQIAGIHGAPFQAWPPEAQGEGESPQYGYCPHGSNLFSTWHRPYLALFEQVLNQHAIKIASEFEDQEKWGPIAANLRLPYWDWAVDPDDQGVMPESLRRETETVTYPNGTQADIPNPLFQYRFHPLEGSAFDSVSVNGLQYNQWETTIRLPEDGRDVNAATRNDEANTRLGTQQPANRDMLYKLLTIPQPFNEWSNKASGGIIGNVETLHDGIHNAFGLGHMGIPEVAAFDPVFWFHHCNVDRIISIFQYRYGDTYVEPEVQDKATFTIEKGSTQDVNSPLTPFNFNPQNVMWNSDLARKWEFFGYTYPEIQSGPNNDTLTELINELYQGRTQGLNLNNTLTAGDSESPITSRNEPAGPNEADAIDWMAEIKMPSDLDITYSVRAFLGAPNDDPTQWPTDPNFAGQVASLTSPRQDSDTILTANIMLTDKLAEKYSRSEFADLTEETVAAWLTDNFFWRIQETDLVEKPYSSLPDAKDIKVRIISVPVHLPQSKKEVPKWVGDFRYHDGIHGGPEASANE